VLQLGQEIEVVVEEIDEKGKVSLTPAESWGGSSDGGSDDAAPARSNGSRDSAASAPSSSSGTSSATPADVVSFDDAFDAELVSEFGDLGPGGEAGGNDKGGDRGPRRDDRNGRGARGGAARRHR
jgi:polyribonucleotide nucleotidyltransferase